MTNRNKIILIICIILFLTVIFVIFANKNHTTDVSNPIRVVYISDDNYIDYMRASIKSLIKNKKKKTQLEIYVIGVDLSEKKSKKVLKESKKQAKINIIKLSSNKLKNLKGNSFFNPEVSRADNAKFFLSTILKDLDKVLYLDCDTIILKDLTDLYNTNLGNNYVAAADDWQSDWYDGNFDKRYFNNGVMLLNLKQMREDSVERHLITFKENDPIDRFVTQDAFNSIMYQRVVFLPLIYDTFAPEYDNRNIIQRIHETLGKNFNYDIYPYEHDSDFRKRVAIIHYCGYFNIKPWYEINLMRASGRIWYRYAPLDFWITFLKKKVKNDR